METLAVVESTPETLASLITQAALHDASETDQEMFVRITDAGIETPASTIDATQASYCSPAAEQFVRLDVSVDTPVDAMFSVDTVLGWLDWFDTDSTAVAFRGDRRVVTEIVLTADQDKVVIDCLDDPAVLENVETNLPGRFSDTQFLDEDGNPMPTTIETTAAELRRLVDAVDLVESEDGYALVVRDGQLVVDVRGEESTARARLDATIDGPAVTNHYGPDFAAVARGLTGPVTLQTGPGEPVAFVQNESAYTLRFVVASN
jgi:hypothetical protein